MRRRSADGDVKRRPASRTSSSIAPPRDTAIEEDVRDALFHNDRFQHLRLDISDNRHPNAYADPTHVRYFNLEAIRYFCTLHHEIPQLWPLIASTDEASIFADLLPLKNGRSPASRAHLARAFGH